MTSSCSAKLLLPDPGRVTDIPKWNRPSWVQVMALLVQRRAIIWTSAELLLVGSFEVEFREISMEIQTILFKKMHLKIFAKCQHFSYLNVLINERFHSPLSLGRNKLHLLNTGRPRYNGHHFCRYHFWINFSNWKCLYFDRNFNEIYS